MSQDKPYLYNEFGEIYAGRMKPLHLRIHEDGYLPTASEIESMHHFAETFVTAKNPGIKVAADSCLHNTGFHTLLGHAYSLGQGNMLANNFMGYAGLSNLTTDGLVEACITTTADDMLHSWVSFKKKNVKNLAIDDFNELDEEEQRIHLEYKDKENEKIPVIEEFIQKYDVKDHLRTAALWSGYFGGCLIFIDTGCPRDKLHTPLNFGYASTELTRTKFKGFQVIEPINCFPGNYNSDQPIFQNFFTPQEWWILGDRVHSSRLIHITSGEIPFLLKPTYNFFGIPRAQYIYDYTIHFKELRVALQRLYTKYSTMVFKGNLKDVLYNNKGAERLHQRLGFLGQNISNDGIMAIDKDTEDFLKFDTNVASSTDALRQALEFIACINKTPAVKLLGISPNGFNATGDSDVRNYYDHIMSENEKILRKPLTKIINIAQLIHFRHVDNNIDFVFNSMGQEDATSIVQRQKLKADIHAVYFDRDLASAEEIREDLATDEESPFKNIDPYTTPEPVGEEGMEGLGPDDLNFNGEPDEEEGLQRGQIERQKQDYAGEVESGD